MPQSNRREGRLDWIRRADVNPVLSREVVEGQQDVSILVQAPRGLGILGLIHFDKRIECGLGVGPRRRHPDLVQHLLRLRLDTLGHLVEHVGRLVDPATLRSCRGIHTSQSLPEAQRAVTRGQLRVNR